MLNCESKLQFFHDLVMIGLDTIMPFKTTKLHMNDAPWVSAEFKVLIKLWQKAFVQGDAEHFRYLRNIVNCERKLLCSRYYTSKVANLKTTKLSQWWNEVKKIVGMASATGSEDIRAHLHLDGIAGQSKIDIANLILDR